MYEVFYGSEVMYASDLDELMALYEKAREESICIEAYEVESRELVLFWCPDPDVERPNN